MRFPDGLADIFDACEEDIVPLARGATKGDILGAGLLLLLALPPADRKTVMEQWMLRPGDLDLNGAEALGRSVRRMIDDATPSRRPR